MEKEFKYKDKIYIGKEVETDEWKIINADN